MAIVRKSVYKNFRIMQIWALKRKYDSGPKMRKLQEEEREEKEEEEEDAIE